MYITLLPQSALRFLRRRWMPVLIVFSAGCAIFWVTTFKILDRDFWWHITAGNILLSTGRLIVTDPFSYTREGMPYLATHEWLAQIILFLVYSVCGSTGIILFRGVVACAAVGMPLLLSQRLRIASVALAVWVVVMMKGSFLERPQLFTFLCFSFFLLLAYRFLDARSYKGRFFMCASWVVVEILWLNLHGGAALLGIVVVGSVLVQEFAYAVPRPRRSEHMRSGIMLGATLVLMSASFVLPPNGLQTLSYLERLLTDQTIQFIAEWQPRAFLLSVKELWIFALLALTVFATARRHIIYTGLLFGAGIYLARQAFRHEILFLLIALSIFVYQSEHSNWRQSLAVRFTRHRALAFMASVLLLLVAGRIAFVRSFNFERQDNLFGFGQFDLARGAVDFLEKNDIRGNMFNTYGIGGYLIYRGYPERKVFIDGRNVDYGFDFMVRTYAAGVDVGQWNALVRTYGIEYAIVDYDAIREDDRLPYSVILDAHPDWALVYMDDWTAIYMKRTLQNQPMIEKFSYAHISPTTVQFRSEFSHVGSAELPEVIAELQRMYSDNPEGVKATLALANIAVREGRMDDARVLVRRAQDVRPYSMEALAVLAAIDVSEEKWEDAAARYMRMVRMSHGQYPDIDYGFIADVLGKAGRPLQARWLLFLHPSQEDEQAPQRAPDAVQPDAETPLPDGSAGESPAAVNPAGDALSFYDRGLDAAGNNDLASAQEYFRTAIMLNPGFAEAWNNLCAVQVSLRTSAEAVRSCERAIELQPEYADAYYNLGLAYVQEGKKEEAREAAMKAGNFGRGAEADELLRVLGEP